MQENLVQLDVTALPDKIEKTRQYLPSPPIMIENTFIENQKFLSNMEKMKLLDEPREKLMEWSWKYLWCSNALKIHF